MHTCEDHWLGWGESRHGGMWVGQMLPISLFFCFLLYGVRRVQEWEETVPSYQTTSEPGGERCPLDIILETSMRSRMFWVYCLSKFDSSEMLLVSLLQGREYLSRSLGCQSSLQCVYSPMYLLPKLSRESCPTHSVLHLLSWHLISSAGTNGLYLVPGLPHGWQEPWATTCCLLRCSV